MKCFVAGCFIICPIILNAQTATKTAVHLLQQSHPEINWNIDSTRQGVFDCDGKRDTVVLGAQRERVAVGVVWGELGKHPTVSVFPLRSPTQDGFCSVPKRVELTAHDCDSGEGTLPGCKVNPSCKDFRIVDDDCDAFNFYWDSEHKELEWWRR